jgi:RNA polymerase sigma-70 factor (ECF subfamily)
MTDLEPRLEAHRRELTAHCRRMLGSSFEADDAVQETLVRAWRGYARFEGRSSLRTWLHRIATNVCYEQLERGRRRPLPVDLFAGERAWDDEVTGDTAELAESREAVRVALLVALQLLPPRQRAVLILREVLRWKAAEVAELFGTSTASVNSSLQRARATLAERQPHWGAGGARRDPLLHQYVDAFERFDVARLVALLEADGNDQLPAAS